MRPDFRKAFLQLPSTLNFDFAFSSHDGFKSGVAVITFGRGEPWRIVSILLHGNEPGDESRTLDPFAWDFDIKASLIRRHCSDAIEDRLQFICGARRAA